MSSEKLKKAIEEKDYLRAKRLIIDNPKYLEENVDCVLDIVKVLSEPIRFADEPLTEERKDELYKYMKEEMKKGEDSPFTGFDYDPPRLQLSDFSYLKSYHGIENTKIDAAIRRIKERAHEEAISENKLKYDQASHEIDKAFVAVCVGYFHKIDGVDFVECSCDYQDVFNIRFTLNKYPGKLIIENFITRHSGKWKVKVYNPPASIESSGEYKEDYLIEFTKKAKRDGQ